MQDFKINSQMPVPGTGAPVASNPASGVSPAQEYQQQNKPQMQTPVQASGMKFKKPSKPIDLGLPSISAASFRR